MSNYIKTTNFAAKDSLPSGNPAKIVKGTEINTEFDNIAVASATKLNSSAVSTFGGTLIDDANASAARTTLGLGTAATTASTDYATAAQGITADAALPRTGGAMTGAITTNSTFDGRDVATDGTKLDGIEAGATADQTAAEIKTAYESNANTNAFTDTDETKLDGIEAGADVTDTTNVVASLSAGTGISLSAGGEIANTAPDQTVALTGAGGTSISGTYPNFTITSSSFALPVATDTTLGGIELFSDTDQTVVANAVTTTAARTYGIQLNSDDQAVVNVPWTDTTYTVGDGGLTEINFTSADNTKLDGIEASADVTDTANVTAAGALMTTGGTLTGDLDVTGTATMDGLTVDGDGSFKTGSGAVLTVGTTNASAAAGQVVGQITFDNADISGNKANAEIRGMAHDAFGRTNIDFRTGDSGSLKTRALVSWNGDISFYEDTGTTPKLFWDASAESLGIGTSSPVAPLHVKKLSSSGAGTPTEVLTLEVIQASNLLAGDGTKLSFHVPEGFQGSQEGAAIAGIRESGSDSDAATSLAFYTAGDDTSVTERLRIDSSGNLLVGKTSADVDTAGTCLRGSISSIFTVDGNVDTQVAIFNRKSNDGTIADFRKDGTTVGSIQSRAGVVSTIVLDPRTNGAGLTGTQNAVEPTNESGVNTDGVLSLGGSSSRFKDLHLSGTANVGSIAVTGAITEDAETLTGTATTIDLATATNFTHTLTGATTYTFSNPATTGNATAFTLKVIQDTTARTITWPASVDWAGGTAPTLTATSGGVDVFVFYTIDGGTTYYGFTAGQAMA